MIFRHDKLKLMIRATIAQGFKLELQSERSQVGSALYMSYWFGRNPAPYHKNVLVLSKLLSRLQYTNQNEHALEQNIKNCQMMSYEKG